MKIAAAAMLLALSVGAQSVPEQPEAVPQQTGSKTPQKEAQQALDFQNKKRAEVGVPPLAWSTELATAAQAWADQLAANHHCGLEHNANTHYGESLFGGNGAFYTALSASQYWYSQKEQYRGDAVTQYNFVTIGHYTQMVWKSTTKVGIGQATCGMALVIVAEYDPRGNVLGEKPYAQKELSVRPPVKPE